MLGPSRRRSAAPAVMESVESRVLFALDVTAQAFSPGQPQLVFTDIATGNANGSGATAVQVVTVRNTGAAAVTITGASITGGNSGEFETDNFPGLPGSIAPGASAAFGVKFRAASTGLKSSTLQITTSDPGQSTLNVALRGIGTASDSNGDVGGQLEPSLQRILNAFQIPVNVGDADGEGSVSFPTPRPGGTPNDEVSMPRLVKAGAGPVTIQTLAAYQFNNKAGPVTRFGYYTPGTPDAKTELFTVAKEQAASTTPGGGATFDPGGAPFALYDTFNGSIFEDANKLPRTAYSEDLFNTWASNVKQKFRFFPLKDANGSVVPNAFVFTAEDFDGTAATSFDNNDLVGIIRNVAAAPSGPEVGTASLDRGLPGPNRLVMSRIQQQPPTTVDPVTGEEIPLPNNVVHDRASVRVYNSGSAPLTISSVSVSNTTDFKINTAGLNGSTINPGASKDIEVQFIAQGGDARSGTLTINTNDPDEPATTVQLAGFWQNRSEHNEEPSLVETVSLMGFGTTIVGPGQELNPAGQSGKVQAVGDEILSPYWRRADPAESVEIVQLAAYHTHNDNQPVQWFLRGSSSPTTVFTQAALDSQSVFPHAESGSLAAGTFKPGGDSNSAFGFKIEQEWSDPTKNKQDGQTSGFGHHVRFWPAKDASGKVIPNTYLMAMDYSGINYDYNDNTYLIRNIVPADATATPPAAPAGLTATGSPSGVALNWNDNTESNFAGYNVYRGSTADFTPSAANRLNSTPLSISEYVDANAPAGLSFYKVTAVNTSGVESAVSSASADVPSSPTPTPTAPATPTGLTAIPASTTSINVSWAASTGATSYLLERRTGGAGNFATIGGSLTATSFADTGLTPSTAYEYRVSAINAAGQSAPSAAVLATTPNVAGSTPVATVGDVTVTEPASGTANATFTVNLNAVPTAPVVLNYGTQDGTAVAGSDYTASSGAITFGPGETSKTILVAVLGGDGLAEPAETFTLNLSLSSGNATIGDAQATATIVGVGDPLPTPEPTIPFGGKTAATFTGSNGRPVKVSLKGPGTGTVTLPAAGGAVITLNGTTAASALKIAGTAVVKGINAGGSLKSITGKTIDLDGDIGIAGSLGKLTLRNASGNHTLSIGNPAAATSLALGSVSDLSVHAAGPIKSLKAATWLDTDASADSITAPLVSSVSIRGGLGADLNVGELGKMSVGGAVSGADVRATGNIGSVRAGALQNSKIFAGVRSDLTTMPAAPSDFTSASTVKSVSVSGRTAGAFSNSMIAASQLGKVSLGTVTTANSGTAFGVSGDQIATVSGTTDAAGKFSAKKLVDPSQSVEQGDFFLRVL